MLAFYSHKLFYINEQKLTMHKFSRFSVIIQMHTDLLLLFDL